MAEYCPICEMPAELGPRLKDYAPCDCLRCGQFRLSGEAEKFLHKRYKHPWRDPLSAAVRKRVDEHGPGYLISAFEAPAVLADALRQVQALTAGVV